MATTATKENPPANKRQGKWWCNFCGLHTDDEAYYRAHSCQEELKKRGAAVSNGKSSHCR